MKTTFLKAAGIVAFIVAALSPTAPAWSQSKATSLSNSDAPINPNGQYNGVVDAVTMPDDARMAVFTYSRDQIFRVITAPLKVTTIEFEKGEQLTADPAMGDSVRWIVDTDGANHVYVKPNQPGLVNTLHLSTNKREYDITLVSSPLGGLFYQSVRFSYWASVHERNLSYEAATRAQLEAQLPHDGGLCRRVEQEPDYLKTIAQAIENRSAQQLAAATHH